MFTDSQPRLSMDAEEQLIVITMLVPIICLMIKVSIFILFTHYQHQLSNSPLNIRRVTITLYK